MFSAKPYVNFFQQVNGEEIKLSWSHLTFLAASSFAKEEYNLDLDLGDYLQDSVSSQVFSSLLHGAAKTAGSTFSDSINHATALEAVRDGLGNYLPDCCVAAAPLFGTLDGDWPDNAHAKTEKLDIDFAAWLVCMLRIGFTVAEFYDLTFRSMLDIKNAYFGETNTPSSSIGDLF